MRVRLRAGDGSIVNAIAFRAAGQALGDALTQYRGQSVHAAGTLCVDRWNGVERVQLRLVDLAPADALPRGTLSTLSRRRRGGAQLQQCLADRRQRVAGGVAAADIDDDQRADNARRPPA